ncbi:MAG TPA: DUF3592 domain-containing protein [Trebonia sp.]|nr:DUF3592 domain-containing protein [Trebonia sp.]
MAAVLGIWIAVAGAVGLLAGLTGSRRVRRLRRGGVRSWAVAVPQPVLGQDDERRVALQYTLADGQVLEKPVPGPARALTPGRSVLVWYDPGDPTDVLVYGREGRKLNLGFIAAGVLFMAVGIAIAVVGR